MDRSRRLFPLALILFIVAAAGLSRTLGHVRAVDAVGLTGSGFAFGIGIMLLVFAITDKARNRT
jgi:hypothetical protein